MDRVSATELADWFDTHAAALVLYARNWVDRAAAEDVVQEVFVRLARLDQRPTHLRAWLLASVRHAATDALRAHRRRVARDRAAGEEWLFERSCARPADALEAREVQSSLASLSPIEREIIVLRIWNSATFEEIAALVAMPLSTVYAKYQAGLQAMRARWEEPCRKP